MSEPVNLTTLAADVELSKDHPIYSGGLVNSATADFPRLDLSIEEICLELFELRARIAKLEQDNGQ